MEANHSDTAPNMSRHEELDVKLALKEVSSIAGRVLDDLVAKSKKSWSKNIIEAETIHILMTLLYII